MTHQTTDPDGLAQPSRLRPARAGRSFTFRFPFAKMYSAKDATATTQDILIGLAAFGLSAQ
jgi:hypothetical protein